MTDTEGSYSKTRVSENTLPSERDDSSDDDDVPQPQLTAHSLAALQEFYAEQNASRELRANNNACGSETPTDSFNNADLCDETTGSRTTDLFQKNLNEVFPEDWQLSQFWYDSDTSQALAGEVLRLAGNCGMVACVSCPSVFRACENASNVHLFEYDTRFRAFGELFHFYDYNFPENFPENCIGAFSVVIVDPPFLSEECLQKVSVTVKRLLKDDGKIILCTGAVMDIAAERVLNLKRSNFVPRHKNNLGNEFACYSNYIMTCIDVIKK